MTPEELDEIERRANQATAGPWTQYDRGIGHEVHITGTNDEGYDYSVPINYGHRSTFSAADAAFITHARSDVPQLVAEVRKLREVAELHRKITRWSNEEASVSEEEYLEMDSEERIDYLPVDICEECYNVEIALLTEQDTWDTWDTWETWDISTGCRSAWPCPTARALGETQ